jgi:tRNA threonylcarbamoyladenosine biosynthesis protein TsaE
MQWRSPSPAETAAAAAALAQEVADAGACIALVGPLGAGKTAFAKGFAAGLGIDARLLASPTFVIAHELPTPGGLRLVHADFYRLENLEELEAVGWVDWLQPGVLLLVEWADRFPTELPADHLEISLVRDDGGPDVRRLEARAHGPESEALLSRWSVGLTRVS